MCDDDENMNHKVFDGVWEYSMNTSSMSHDVLIVPILSNGLRRQIIVNVGILWSEYCNDSVVGYEYWMNTFTDWWEQLMFRFMVFDMCR